METNKRYVFTFEEDQNNSYSFRTDNQTGYVVKFVPSNYLFGHTAELAVTAYEMIIAVTDGRNEEKIPSDGSIYYTVAAIFNHFFDKHEKVIVFVCDTSDGRQRARARKFTTWFYRGIMETGLTVSKIDRCIIASDDEQILMSIFIHLQHPHRLAIIDAFFEISNEEK